jgi:hypothetical protein
MINFIVNKSLIRKPDNYKPAIILMIVYNIPILIQKNIIINILEFFFFNKFLKGVKIIKSKPTTLLIKKRG